MQLFVPLSGTEGSERGLELAISMATRLGATIDLINVIDTGSVAYETFDVRYSAASAYLEAVAVASQGDVQIRTHLLTGDPFEEISRIIDGVDDCVLILAPRWQGEQHSFMPDSLSERLMHSTTAPVVLVPQRYEVATWSTGSVIVPVTRMSPRVEDILTICRTLRYPEIAVSLVAVNAAMGHQNGHPSNGAGLEAGSQAERDEYQARLRLLSLGNQLRNHGVRSHWELRVGAPVHEIIRAADTTGAGFIAFARPSVDDSDDEGVVVSALTVSHQAGVPVLIVPAIENAPNQSRDGVALTSA